MHHPSHTPWTPYARRAWGWLAASLLLLGASHGWAADPTASGQSLSTNQNTALNLTLTGADADGDALGFAITTSPTKGTLSCGLTSGCTSPYAYNYNPAADTDNGTCAYTSCLQILRSNPNAATGNYTIDPDGTGPRAAITARCDMTTDGGGYTYYPITNGATTAKSADHNSCRDAGLEVVVPRTKAHFTAMLNLYGTDYFQIVPGIVKSYTGGNDTYFAFNSNSVQPNTWHALDGGPWWVRDTPFGEPNGDYGYNCWLGMYGYDPNNFQFNDLSGCYADDDYICSTNDKKGAFDSPKSVGTPTSCAEILRRNNSAASGTYAIDPDGSGSVGTINVYCDMTTDGGGYTYYPVSGGARTYRSSDYNNCKGLGMEIAIPRTKAHFTAMRNLYGDAYFEIVPGIKKATAGGNYAGCVMKYNPGTACNDWQALDGGTWWLRDSAYSEPSGDYQGDCWLGFFDKNPNNTTFNDGNCIYSSANYICSTNDKDGAVIDRHPYSCAEIKKKTPGATSGNYTIQPGNVPVNVYCDMTTDGGGYTYHPIAGGLTTARSTDPNTCRELGMDIVIPRTQAHLQAMSTRYGVGYFQIIPGISKATSGGNYQGCAMNSGSNSPCSNDWKATDGGSWFMRNSAHVEPSGDYTADCWLGTIGYNWNGDAGNLLFNDGACGYASNTYLCSTNDKDGALTPYGEYTSCMDARQKLGSTAPSGVYRIDPDGPRGPRRPLHARCDMSTDGGGYTYVPVHVGKRFYRTTDQNSCRDMGLDVAVPRTEGHWAAMFSRYGQYYLQVAPGISRPYDSGNFSGTQMRFDGFRRAAGLDHHYAYSALDRRSWFLRSSTYGEPSGNYQPDCVLAIYNWASNNIQFDDNQCSFSSNRYLCATNDKYAHADFPETIPNKQPSNTQACVYTPGTNQTGADSFVFRVSDGNGGVASATVNINIISVNQPPTANAQGVSLNEDATLLITLTGSDPENQALTYNVGSPTTGTLTGTGNTRTYTPPSNFSGTATFTFTVSDGVNTSPAATVTITVNPVNDTPSAANGSLTLNEDAGATALTLTASDVETAPGSLTYTITQSPTKGTLSCTFQSCTYTPTLNQSGADLFKFIARDPQNATSNEATFNITITPVNDAPVAVAGSLTVNEDAAATNLTLSASDVDGNTLTYTIVTPPTKGTLGGSGNARTYTPTANLNGPDSFTFKVNDGTVDSATVTFSITINPINDAPVATAGSLTVNEDSAATNLTLSASDADGNALTYIIVTNPTKGTLGGSGNARTYTPSLNQNGADSFTFKVNDGTVDSATVTFNITITPVNDAPVAVADAASTNEDAPLTVAAPGVLSNDTEVDGQALTAVLNGGMGNTVTFQSKWGTLGAGSGQFNNPYSLTLDSAGNVYVADSGNNRIQKFNSSGTYLTQWGTLGSGNGQLNNPASVAVDSSGNVYVAEYSNNRVQKFNSSGTYLTKWGTLGAGNGQFTNPAGVAVDSAGNVYVADTNNNRVQKFDANGTYLAQWGSLGSGDGQFRFATNIAIDTSNNIYVTDSDNDRVQVFTSAGVFVRKFGSAGTGDGQFDYPYGIALDSAGNIYVTDHANNRAQKFNSTGTFLGKWGSSGSGDGQFAAPSGISVNSSGVVYTADLNDRVQTFTQAGNTAATSKGSVTLNTNGSYTYTPNPNATGTDTFQYRARDASNTDSALTTVTITINPVNDAPVATNVAATTNEDTAASITLAATDIENDALTFAVVTPPSNGTVTCVNPAAQTTAYNFRTITGTAVTLADDAGSAAIPIGFSYTYFGTTYTNAYISSNGFVSFTNSGLNQPAAQSLPNAITPDNLIAGYWADLNPALGGTIRYQTLGTAPNREFVVQYSAIPHDPGGNPATFQIILKENGEAEVQCQTCTTDGTNHTQGAENTLGTAGYTLPGRNRASFSATSSGMVFRPNANNTPNCAYTPNANFNGTDTFTYRANDGTANSGNATATITVTSVNDLPVANVDNYLLNEDAALNQAAPGVLSNDTDAENQPLTAVAYTTLTPTLLNQWGSFGTGDGFFDNPQGLAVDSAGNIYLADRDNHRIQVFNSAGTFIRKWGTSGTGDGQFNTPYAVAVDTSGNVYVADTNNNRVQVFNSTGTFVRKWGSVGGGDGQFQGPRGIAVDSASNVYVTEFTNNRVQVFTSAGTFVRKWGATGTGDGQFQGPVGVAVSPMGSVFIGEYTGNRVQVFTSAGAFVRKWGASGSANGQFINPAHLALDMQGNLWVADFGNNRVQRFTQAGTHLLSNTQNQIYAVAFSRSNLLVTSDLSSQRLKRHFVGSAVANGTLTLNANGSFSYTPNANFFGTDSFSYLARDTAPSDSAPTTVVITVSSVNDAPVAAAATVNTDEDTAVSFNLSATDADGQTLTYTALTMPTKGSVTCSGAGACTYTPNANTNGLDSFTFKANDGTVDSNSATLTINVRGLNDTPVANAQTLPATEDMTLNLVLSANDNDGDALTYSLVSQPTGGKGAVTCVGRNCTFTPTANANGATTFTFKANDGTIDSNTATVTINITAVNDAPTATSSSATVNLGTPLLITLVASDVDGDALSYQITTNPTNGTLTGSGNTRTYTANPNYSGPDSFVFRVTDGTLTASATVTLTVINPGLPNPTVTNTTPNAWQGGTVRLTGTISDGTCTTSPTVTVTPNTTTVALTGGNGSWSYQSPVLNPGSYNYTVSVTSACSTKTGSATAIFGVDTTGTVINYSTVPQGGVNPGDQNTWPIYTSLDEVQISAILQDSQSGLANSESAVIEVGNGNNTVILGTQTFATRNGNPPTGLLASGSNLCSHNTRCAANKLKLSANFIGPTIIRLRATDVAGNTTTNNYYLRVFDLRQTLVAWRDRIEALSGVNTTTQNNAIAKLNAALTGYDNGQFGNAILGMEDAWFALSGSEQTSTLTEATRTARTGVSHYQGLVNQARLDHPEVSAQDEFDTADSHLTTARSHADLNAPGDAFLSIANAFFWKGEGEAPFFAADFGTSLDTLDRILGEMDAYITFVPVLPGQTQTANSRTELSDAQVLAEEIVTAGFAEVLSDLEHLELLLVLANTAEFLKTSENQTVWVRNWQWGLTQVVYVFAQRGLNAAESQGYGGPIIAEGYEQLRDADTLKSQFRADEFMQLLIDSRCLILGIYNLSYDPDASVPPVCCDDIIAYNSIDPNVPVPNACQ